MKDRKDYVVLVDMDDTIVDLLSRWVSFLNETHGLSVNPEEITDWNISLFFPTLTKEQVFAPLFTDKAHNFLFILYRQWQGNGSGNV